MGRDGLLDTDDLKRHLRRFLPPYMVPEVVAPLDAMPLTPNGKIDRSKLASIALDGGSSRAYEPPRSDVEVRLAALWKEHLGVSHVGREDSFLELGGHSLSAMRLMGRVERELGVRVPLTILLQDRTLREIAETVEGLMYVASAPEADDPAEDYEAVEL